MHNNYHHRAKAIYFAILFAFCISTLVIDRVCRLKVINKELQDICNIIDIDSSKSYSHSAPTPPMLSKSEIVAIGFE